MTGQIGRYFYSFGITSAAAILLSMFVSFTLTPALCAMWLKPEDAKSDHSTTKSSRPLRADRPRLRPHAGVVARAPRRDDRASPASWCCRPRSSTPTSARSWCPTTTRASSASTCACRAAPATRGPRSSSSRSRRKCSALPALQRVMQNVNSGFASFNITMVPLEERTISQQQLMIAGAPDAAQVPGRAHQRVGRHRHLGRVDRRRARRRRRQLQPAEHPDPGPGHRAAAGVHRRS